ncbi:hypothetical protein K488DRAFT_89406 [Vararia minispora EC-137]|uniref:Uncharacterized protein n=1 Tax=Vararia minispora EC-137 TaxID=1314806 RepID=A0ACB8QAR0_9AGAM|nr:hypothetical protein K488DRAFT_89406 [Vararia minispora EC-137]
MTTTTEIPHTQRAAVYTAPGKIEIRDDWLVVQPSELKYGQCLIRMEVSSAGWTHIVVPIPEGLPSEIAAPTLCAGLTVYRGLKESNTKAGDWIAIPGAGGGLGHMAVQYAFAMGLRVVAIDSGEDKKKISLKNGAEKWIDFTKAVDVVADVSVYDDALRYVRASGTLVVLAIPAGSLKVNIDHLVSKNLKIHASIVGCLQDTIEALDFVVRGKVIPHIHKHKLEDLGGIFNSMRDGKLVGRAIIYL